MRLFPGYGYVPVDPDRVVPRFQIHPHAGKVERTPNGGSDPAGLYASPGQALLAENRAEQEQVVASAEIAFAGGNGQLRHIEVQRDGKW